MAGSNGETDTEPVVLLQDCSQLLKNKKKGKTPISDSYIASTSSSEDEREEDTRKEPTQKKFLKKTEVNGEEKITADLWNALSSCPVLSSLTEKAKKKIKEELLSIEKKHTKRLRKANKNLKKEKDQTWAETCRNLNTKTEVLQHELAEIKKSIINSHTQTREVMLQLATSNQQHDINEKLTEIAEKCETLKEVRTQAVQPRSYAAATANKRTVLIRAQEPTKAQEIMQSLNSKECPPGITIEKMQRKNKNVEIVCSTEQECSDLQEHLMRQVPEEVPVEGKKPPSMRLILFNVPETCTEEQMGQAINRTTRIPGTQGLLRRIAARREEAEHWVLEVPREQGEELLTRGCIFLGYRRINLRRYFIIRRCHRCQRIGIHTAANCPNQAYCEQCAGNHNVQQCPKRTTCCVNCKKANAEERARNPKTKELAKTDHPASDPSCPAFRKAMRELSQR